LKDCLSNPEAYFLGLAKPETYGCRYSTSEANCSGLLVPASQQPAASVTAPMFQMWGTQLLTLGHFLGSSVLPFSSSKSLTFHRLDWFQPPAFYSLSSLLPLHSQHFQSLSWLQQSLSLDTLWNSLAAH
jgi:hypothetical protein